MSTEQTRQIEQALAHRGFGGLRVRADHGVATLGGALPVTAEALAALEAAFALDGSADPHQAREARS